MTWIVHITQASTHTLPTVGGVGGEKHDIYLFMTYFYRVGRGMTPSAPHLDPLLSVYLRKR